MSLSLTIFEKIFQMAKIDSFKRWLLIVQKVRRKPSTLEEIQNYLDNHFEKDYYNLDISQRTFQRDLVSIYKAFGVSIQYNRRDNWYEIVEEESDVSYERIIESFDIVNALKTSEKVSDYIFLENRKSKGTEHLHGIIHAIQNQFLVTFNHESYWNETIKTRKCIPIAIKEAQNRWYLIGIDVEKNEVRNFGLERISNFIVTHEKKEIPTINIYEYYKNAFGIETYNKAEKIILEFNNSQKKYITSLPFHVSQKIINENKNTFLIELYLHPTHDFKMEILRFGNWCEVIEPNWYRNEVKETVELMSKKYK